MKLLLQISYYVSSLNCNEKTVDGCGMNSIFVVIALWLNNFQIYENDVVVK